MSAKEERNWLTHPPTDCGELKTAIESLTDEGEEPVKLTPTKDEPPVYFEQIKQPDGSLSLLRRTVAYYDVREPYYPPANRVDEFFVAPEDSEIEKRLVDVFWTALLGPSTFAGGRRVAVMVAPKYVVTGAGQSKVGHVFCSLFTSFPSPRGYETSVFNSKDLA